MKDEMTPTNPAPSRAEQREKALAESLHDHGFIGEGDRETYFSVGFREGWDANPSPRPTLTELERERLTLLKQMNQDSPHGLGYGACEFLISLVERLAGEI